MTREEKTKRYEYLVALGQIVGSLRSPDWLEAAALEEELFGKREPRPASEGAVLEAWLKEPREIESTFFTNHDGPSRTLEDDLRAMVRSAKQKK